MANWYMSVLPEHRCQQGANDPYFAAREKDWQVLQRNYIGNMALSTLKASAVAQIHQMCTHHSSCNPGHRFGQNTAQHKT